LHEKAEVVILYDPQVSEAAPIAASPVASPMLEGFPRLIEGEMLLCLRDNIDTDGIYAGRSVTVTAHVIAFGRGRG
jgi:hypothetical protein